MFGTAASRIVARIQPSAVHATRNMSVISGPPTVRVSFAEKVAHGVFIFGGVLAIPIWVLVNMKHYKQSQ